jgi:hypothetical protein
MKIVPLRDAGEGIQNFFENFSGAISINIGSTNPLEAISNFYKRSSDKYMTAIYRPPQSESYWLYVTQREALLLRELIKSQWLELPVAKDSGETRKPISNLRQFGFLIATNRTGVRDKNGERISRYRLIGEIKVSPTKEDLASVPSLPDSFPSADEAKRMTLAEISQQASKRRASAKKKAKNIQRRRKK